MPMFAQTPALARGLIWAAALLTIAATARLGFWQLDRAAQKTTLAAAISAQKANPAPDFIAFAASKIEANAVAWQAEFHRPIAVQGRWLAEHTVFLDNRQMNGKPGFFVLTPLLLEGVKSPSGQSVAWLVQRGWVPRNFLQRDALPSIATSSGTVRLPARIAPPPAKLLEMTTAAPSPGSAIRQNFDPMVMSQALGSGVRLIEHSSLLQLVQDPPAPDGLLRDWPEPTSGVAKHQGYAAQWFGLSGLVAALLMWFQVLVPMRKKKENT